MASVYFERLLSEDQKQKGFEFREEIFRNSEAFKTGLVTNISDIYDDVAEHVGFYSGDKLIGYVRIIPWTEKLQLPYITRYHFETVDCEKSHLFEVSRLSITENLNIREVLGLFRLLNEITSKVFKAHRVIISIAKNCIFYESKFGFSRIQQSEHVFLMQKIFNAA